MLVMMWMCVCDFYNIIMKILKRTAKAEVIFSSFVGHAATTATAAAAARKRIKIVLSFYNMRDMPFDRRSRKPQNDANISCVLYCTNEYMRWGWTSIFNIHTFSGFVFLSNVHILVCVYILLSVCSKRKNIHFHKFLELVVSYICRK